MEKAQKLTNTKIAEVVGVSESLVSRWKKGERKINPEVAVLLGKLFRVKPAEFVFDNGDLAYGKKITEILEREIKINNNC